MDVDDFVSANAPDEASEGGEFQLENPRMLDANVDGTVMAKSGAMVAYEGDLDFTGKVSAEGGVKGMLKSAVSSEGTPIMQVEGSGSLYLADQGKNVQVIHLEAGEELSVNGEDVLAFGESVDYEIRKIDSLSAASTGGLTNVFLSGPGSVAVTTHGEPLVLTPPVRTDPAATVAWSGDCSPGSHVNRSLSDMVGSSSDETYQLEFTGSSGYIVVQPYEERTA